MFNFFKKKAVPTPVCTEEKHPNLKLPIFSASKAFVLYEHFGRMMIGINQEDGGYRYKYWPVAELKPDYEIVGLVGNSGDRFERLTPIEKMDIATIIVRMKNELMSK